MKLIEFYLDAIQKRFSANATVEAIEKKIEEIAQILIFKKYKNESVFYNNLEFKLEGVMASLSTYTGNTNISNMGVTLTYFCVSKLPKVKRERLAKVKDDYKNNNGYIGYNTYKVPIWKQLYYTLDVERVLQKDFNLNMH